MPCGYASRSNAFSYSSHSPRVTDPIYPERRMNQPSVLIVILNWNGLADTLECVSSLNGLMYENKSIIVVDNGSGNDEATRIASALPSITVIRNDENRGYAGGNNVGICHALARGAEYIWLLNNDTTVAPTCLTELVNAVEQRPDVGLLSPIIYHHDSSDELQFTGAVLDRQHAVHHTLRTMAELEAAAKENPILLWGTALLLKRKAVQVVGLLDERYFAYHEDMDYCLRVLAAGFRTLVVTTAKVYHKTGRSLGPGDSPVREYLLVRNWYLFWTTYHVGWQRRVYPSRYLAWALERVLNSMRAGRLHVADHALDGIWDAFRGHWGTWQAKGRMPWILRAILTKGLLAWHPYVWLMILAGDTADACREAIGRLCGRYSR